MKVYGNVSRAVVFGLALVVCGAGTSSVLAGAEGARRPPRQPNVLMAGTLKIVLPAGSSLQDWNLQLVSTDGRITPIEVRGATIVIENLRQGEYKLLTKYKNFNRLIVFNVYDRQVTKVVL